MFFGFCSHIGVQNVIWGSAKRLRIPHDDHDHDDHDDHDNHDCHDHENNASATVPTRQDFMKMIPGFRIQERLTGMFQVNP